MKWVKVSNRKPEGGELVTCAYYDDGTWCYMEAFYRKFDNSFMRWHCCDKEWYEIFPDYWFKMEAPNMIAPEVNGFHSITINRLVSEKNELQDKLKRIMDIID